MDYGVVVVDDRDAVSLESGDSPRLVKGLDALFQKVVMELCSDYKPGRGGSGFARALLSTSSRDPNAVGLFKQKLRLARENVLVSQQDGSLPLAEQLESLELLSVVYGDGWEAEIMLVNRSGDTMTRVIAPSGSAVP